MDNKNKEISFSDRAMRWIGSPASLVLHTLAFAGCFALILAGVALDTILLVLTTAVSLEAIYLAIFIQMAVNKTTASLEGVEEDIDDIQEDVDEIQKDVDEIQEDVDEIQKDVDDIEEDVDEIQKDTDSSEQHEIHTKQLLGAMEAHLRNLMNEIQELKKENGEE